MTRWRGRIPHPAQWPLGRGQSRSDASALRLRKRPHKAAWTADGQSRHQRCALNGILIAQVELKCEPETVPVIQMLKVPLRAFPTNSADRSTVHLQSGRAQPEYTADRNHHIAPPLTARRAMVASTTDVCLMRPQAEHLCCNSGDITPVRGRFISRTAGQAVTVGRSQTEPTGSSERQGARGTRTSPRRRK